MKTATKAIVLLMSICFGAFASLADITTGWKSPLTSTTYTWSDTVNWVDDEINGIFSEGLVGSGKTYPNIVFSADAALSGGLVLAYTNNEQYVTFRGDGGDRTLTLGGPVSMNLNKATKGSLKFGSTTADQGLSLVFTSAPVFDIGYGPWMELFQPVSGSGTTLVTGASGTATILTLHGDAATLPGAVSVTPNKGLYFNSNDKNSIGATRASDVRLDRADLVVQGNTEAASVDRISGALTLAGGGMSQFVHYHNSNFKNHKLQVGSLVAESGAMLDIHSPSLVLGTTDSKSGNNFIVDNGVTTFGTGAAGTVKAPVVPFARASNNNSTDDNLFGYLVSYDTTRGFRILDRATEQEEYVAGYEGPVTNQGANVYVSVGSGESVEFTGANVVNSIQLATAGALRATNGTLTVSSGAVEMTGSDNISLNANLAFGAVPGYITYRGDKKGYMSGDVSGQSGVTFQSHYQCGAGNAGLTVSATGSYTGDTYINSRLAISSSAFLPGGDRTGDIYLNNILFIDGGTYNGLNGNESGSLRRLTSGNGTISFGDNDADGDFAGTIAQNKGTFTIHKIGSGTQRLACSSMVGINGLQANAGTLILDGTLSESSVTVEADATFGGNGTIAAGGITFAEGAKFAVFGSNGVVSCMKVSGSVTGGSVTINASVTGKKWRTAQCIIKCEGEDSSITATFVRGEGIGALELRNNDTELWATPKSSGLSVFIR